MKNIKLNSVIYNKLILQAEEAKNQGLEKLADNVISSMDSFPREDGEIVTISNNELSSEIDKKLWSIAMDYIKYHDLQSVDIQKVAEFVKEMSEKIGSTINSTLQINSNIGPLEPKLAGQR